MKLKLALIATLLTLTACKPSTDSIGVTSFDECVAAGNAVMESYPRQCRHEGQTFVEKVDSPTPERPTDEQPCTREFRPVCGEIIVNCFTTPCPSLKATFNNRCLAENEGAQNITEGACVDEKPNPEGACLSFDGNWLEATQECEGMAQEQCENLGGSYNECASACRNDPGAELCTLQCVQVCQF